MAKNSGKLKATWGFCENRAAKTRPLQSACEVNRADHDSLYYWQPSPRLGNDVPRNESFSIVLRCRVLSDGTRCFFAAPNFDTFIAQAQLAGLAILLHQNKLGRARRNSYRFDWFLYQYARRMQQFIRRKFHSRRDLLVTSSGRETRAGKHVLPWENSPTKKDAPRLPATPDALIARGGARAIQEGFAHPTAQQQIQYGFIEAAEQLPRLSPQKNEIRGLLRTVLFNISSKESGLQKKHIAVVNNRLARALGDHLDDATMELFNAWLWGPKSTVIKQVAKQRKARGGELERDEVRETLLELGWQAYGSVAECVEALAIDFRKSIRPCLTRREIRLFNWMFLRQKCFAGLSLIMLDERLDFIGGHFGRLALQPDDAEQLAIFYRLLSFYGVMIHKRRAADQKSKKRLHGCHPESTFHPNDETKKLLQSDNSKSRLDAIAAKVCATQGLRCRCRTPDFQMDDVQCDGGNWSARIKCRNNGCRFLETVEFSACDCQGLIPPE
jgi:hypothetical protein